MNWDFDARVGLHKLYLQNPGDTVKVLGFADVLDTLGYDQIISVNDGAPQHVDGTPYAGLIYKDRNPPEAHEVVRAIKAREAFIFHRDTPFGVGRRI
jgi:hypothetical protein